jgi:hypothetical protein
VSIELQSSPSNSARKAKPLQICGVVLRDARRQHLFFPRRRRELETLQLPNNLKYAFATMELRLGLHVLPAKQKADEVGGADWLDLTAQAAERQAVDAGQESALAPVNLSFLFYLRTSVYTDRVELSLKDYTGGFQSEKSPSRFRGR